MILLMTKSLPEVKRLSADGYMVGRLYTPRHYNALKQTNESGLAWAADNDGFQGVDHKAFMQMLSSLEPHENCLFVTAPDILGDAKGTMKEWASWHEHIAALGFPPAYVLQDGLGGVGVPWNQTSAIFIGGSTEFKFSPMVARTAKEAKERGKWVHMGRVNTVRRLRYAASIGCDSVDGSQWSRFTDRWAHMLRILPYEQTGMAT